MEECGLAVEGGENEVGGVGHVAGDEDDALEAGEAVTAPSVTQLPPRTTAPMPMITRSS